MGAETRDIRNEEAKKLLDYGFANYGLYRREAVDMKALTVKGGVTQQVLTESEGFSAVLPKEKLSCVQSEVVLPEVLTAPITQGERLGCIAYYVDGEKIGESGIYSKAGVEKISFWVLFRHILSAFSLCE